MSRLTSPARRDPHLSDVYVNYVNIMHLHERISMYIMRIQAM